MNQVNKICVVGNKLERFADNHNVFTAKQFLELLSLERKMLNGVNRYEVHIGQGLNNNMLKKISQQASFLQLKERLVFKGILDGATRAENNLTHKQKAKNTLISSPEQVEENFFRAYLMLDEGCADMSDHLTGQHIQGMVLVEAARQMVNAVSEKFLVEGARKGKVGFVLNTMDSTFYHYAFPLEIAVSCQLINIRRVKNGFFSATAEIVFCQYEKKIMSIKLNYSVTCKKFLHEKESSLANDSLDKVLGLMSNNSISTGFSAAIVC